jgi:hypothetical protein
MLPPFLRRPLKPNWWTIFPLVATLVLWGGIIFAGAWTGSALSDKAERVAAISVSDEAASIRH